MLFRPVSLAFVTALSATLAFSQTNNALLDGTKVPPPALAPPKTPLSPEMRGDIFMARKMYREAVESFSEGSTKDPVLKNKTGIAFHQLLTERTQNLAHHFTAVAARTAHGLR